MRNIDHATAAAAPPAVPAPGTEGYFTDGDPAVPTPATVVQAWWLNMLQAELRYVVTQAGLTPDKMDNTQVYQAILQLIQTQLPTITDDRIFVASATFEGTVADGDVVLWDDGNSRFAKATADGTANNRAVGVADVTGTEVTLFGTHSVGLAGMTAGVRQFLDAVTAGGLTETQPVDSISLGIAKSATVLYVDIDATLVSAAGGVVAESRNLVAVPNGVNPTYQIDLDADEIVLKDAGTNAYVATGVNVTADITVSGAGGLDTGAEASSTWYYLWAIYNGTAVAGLLSVSATAPTLPGGYTYKALVGFVRNDGASNFETIRIDDRRFFTNPIQVFSKTAAVAETWESASISTAVPTVAKSAHGFLGVDELGHTGMAVAGDASGLGAQAFVAQNADSGREVLGVHDAMPFSNIPLKTAQTIYWQAGATDRTMNMELTGGTF